MIIFFLTCVLHHHGFLSHNANDFAQCPHKGKSSKSGFASLCSDGSESTMLPFLLIAIVGGFLSCLVENAPLHAYSPGDIVIGGLFPIQKLTNRKTTQGPLTCSE